MGGLPKGTVGNDHWKLSKYTITQYERLYGRWSRQPWGWWRWRWRSFGRRGTPYDTNYEREELRVVSCARFTLISLKYLFILIIIMSVIGRYNSLVCFVVEGSQCSILNLFGRLQSSVEQFCCMVQSFKVSAWKTAWPFKCQKSLGTSFSCPGRTQVEVRFGAFRGSRCP